MAFQTVKALQRGGERSQRGNPNGPAHVVAVFQPGARRPSLRKSLACSELKITRTCSLSSMPSPHSRTGVVLKNNVCSDLTAQTSLGTWSITETTQENETWRRGYYDKPRSWEERGPQAGDDNQLTRKFAAQKTFQSESMPHPKRTLDERLSAKAQALSRQAAKRRRLKEEQHPARSGDSESSTSSSSSSSSSS